MAKRFTVTFTKRLTRVVEASSKKEAKKAALNMHVDEELGGENSEWEMTSVRPIRDDIIVPIDLEVYKDPTDPEGFYLVSPEEDE